MKQITMDWDTYRSELNQERMSGVLRGQADTLYDISVIKELVDGEDPYQALEYINDSFEGEQRELLIKIFGLEEIDKEETP